MSNLQVTTPTVAAPVATVLPVGIANGNNGQQSKAALASARGAKPAALSPAKAKAAKLASAKAATAKGKIKQVINAAKRTYPATSPIVLAKGVTLASAAARRGRTKALLTCVIKHAGKPYRVMAAAWAAQCKAQKLGTSGLGLPFNTVDFKWFLTHGYTAV